MAENLFDHLLDHALEGIIVTDLRGTIILSNRTVFEILGHDPDGLPGSFIGNVFPATSTLHLLPNLIRIASEPGGFEGEIMLSTHEDQQVLVRLRAEPFPEKSPDRIIFRFLDWREVRDLMSDLRDTSQMAVLGNLLQSMAHEIRNPITSIGGFSRKLKRALSDGTPEKEWALQIEYNARILESLINTVQNFVQLPSPNFEKRSLEAVVERILEDTAPLLESRSIILDRRWSKTLMDLYLDPDLLEKALKAVIINGVERMPHGGSLTVSGRSDGNFCRLTIDDTGPSMDAHQMEEDLSPIHVLRVFHSDLNLAIANRIVDEHNGQLSLSSNDPEGLRVAISLPLDRRRISRA